MQNNSINYVPVYQNGVLTWAPASQTVQGNAAGQNNMVAHQMVPQRQMMEPINIQNRTRASAVVPNITYVKQNQQVPPNVMHHQGMIQGNQLIKIGDPYVQAGPGPSANAMNYGTPMVQHNIAMVPGKKYYQTSGYDLGDQSMGNSHMMVNHAASGNQRQTALHNPMDCTRLASASPLSPRNPNSIHNYDVYAQGRNQQFARVRPQPSAGVVMTHNHPTDPNAGHTYVQGQHNAMHVSRAQDMSQGMAVPQGHHVGYQHLQPVNQYVNCNPQIIANKGQQMGTPNVAYSVPMAGKMGTLQNTSPQQNAYIQSIPMRPTPGQYTGHHQQSPKDGMATSTNNEIARIEQMTGPVNFGSRINNNQAKLHVSPENIPSSRINQANEQKGVRPDQNGSTKGFNGLEVLANENANMAMAETMPVLESMSSTKGSPRKLTLNSKWQLKEPKQMLYFEFYIDSIAYEAFSQFLSNLIALPIEKTFKGKKSPPMMEREDLQIVMQDDPEIKYDRIDNVIVKKIIDKLSSFNCCLVEKYPPRRMVRWAHPDRKCILLSDFTKYELQFFLGSTNIENGAILALYHRLICDENPEYLYNKENRKYKAMSEKQLDLYMHSTGYILKVALRRLADIQEKSFQITFGAETANMIDFIMRVF